MRSASIVSGRAFLCGAAGPAIGACNPCFRGVVCVRKILGLWINDILLAFIFRERGRLRDAGLPINAGGVPRRTRLDVLV